MCDKDNKEEYKVSIPIISELELQHIDNNMDTYIKVLTEHLYHDRELIILKRIILNQQKEIEELKRIIRGE